MTYLPTPLELEDLGIDTLPRLVLFSSFGLLSVIKSPISPLQQFNSSVRVAINSQTQRISIINTFMYDRETFLRENGNILKAIVPFSGQNPFTDWEPVPPTDPTAINVGIPSYPSYVTTLEQIFVWAATQLEIGYRRYLNQPTAIQTQILDEALLDGNPTIRITLSVDYSHNLFLCEYGLLLGTFEPFDKDPCAVGILANAIGRPILFEDDQLLSLGLV